MPEALDALVLIEALAGAGEIGAVEKHLEGERQVFSVG